MTTPEPAELLPTETAAALVDFARTCKAAARAVSLYPPEHPAIGGALARVEEAARRMTASAPVTNGHAVSVQAPLDPAVYGIDPLEHLSRVE